MDIGYVATMPHPPTPCDHLQSLRCCSPSQTTVMGHCSLKIACKGVCKELSFAVCSNNYVNEHVG